MYSEEFLENLRKQIYDSRIEEEKQMCSHSFISLGDEKQKLSLSLEDKEEKEFAKGLGFEIGSFVRNKNNDFFYVNSISDMGGMLWIKDIDITLVKESYSTSNYRTFFANSFKIYDRNVVKTRPLYGIDEYQYMDLYEPVLLKISKQGQISLI